MLASGYDSVNRIPFKEHKYSMAIEKIRPRLVDETQDYVFNNVTATGNLTTSNANLGNLAIANYVTGTLTTNAQPNVTSLGTLGNLTVTGNVAVGNLKTDHLLYSNGSPWAIGTTITVAGSNTQLQFNDNGSFAGSANLTFDKTTGTLSVTSIIANGSSLTNLTGSSVTGQVANSLVASTVYSSAQPNITSVGTLTTLAVTGNITSGNATLGNLTTSNYFSGNGSLLSSITGANVTGQVAYAAAANSVAGTNVSGQVAYAATANAVAGANVLGQVSNAVSAGTVYTNAQPNITSVGALTSLSVTGNVTANYFIGNGSMLTGVDLLTVGNADVANRIANGTSNVNIPSPNGNVTFGVNGTGNVVIVTSTGVNVTGYVSTAELISSGNITAGSGSGGNLTGANIISANTFIGTLATSSQPNITSIGTLSSLAVTANVAAGNVLTDHLLYSNGVAWSLGTTTTIGGAATQIQFNDGNTLGGNAGLTFNKTTTTLTANNFVATSTANLGLAGNVKITGGSTNQLLQTDGTGNLTWVTPTGTTITVDNFTANGAQTAFTLSTTPTSKTYTMVSMAGTLQPRSIYSLAGNVITFSSAPPNTAPIEVTTFASVFGYGSSDFTANTITANTLSGNIISANSNLTVNTLTANSVVNGGSGTPTLQSNTSIVLSAATVVRVSTSPMQFYTCTTTVRDTIAASNGYVIYNTTTNKLQVYANGAWADLN